MENKIYHLRYLPIFEQDLISTASYITNVLKNEDAALRLIDDIEDAILERLNNPVAFEPYVSAKKRDYPYYRIYVRNENGLTATVAKAFAISVMSLPYTIVIFLILTAAASASIQTYASILAALAIWLLIGFALTGYLCCLMFYRAFRRFTRKEDLPDDTVDERMYALREQYRKSGSGGNA